LKSLLETKEQIVETEGKKLKVLEIENPLQYKEIIVKSRSKIVYDCKDWFHILGVITEFNIIDMVKVDCAKLYRLRPYTEEKYKRNKINKGIIEVNIEKPVLLRIGSIDQDLEVRPSMYYYGR